MTSPSPPTSVRKVLSRSRTKASSLIETVALAQGHTVERCGPKVVLLPQEQTNIAFYGMLGPSIGHATQLFAGSLALPRLRWSQAGLPVAGFHLLPRSDPEGGRVAARRCGEAAMVGSVVPGAGHNHLTTHADADGFSEAWRRVVLETGSGRLHSRIIVEPVPRGRDVRVAVVGGDVVYAVEVVPSAFNQRPEAPGRLENRASRHVTLDSEVRELVRAAWETLPQIAYCTLHLELTHSTSKLRHVELEPELATEPPDPADERLLRSIIELELEVVRGIAVR